MRCGNVLKSAIGVKMRLLDTDILIDIVRKHPPALLWFSSNRDVLFAPGFAYMELAEGCRNKDDLAAVLKMPKIVYPVWPDTVTLELGFDLHTQYHLSHSLGILDSLIAATAIGQGATLCTFNVKHFAAVPGLTTEQPYVRI
jgi:predicted nucleic acid-binding protein